MLTDLIWFIQPRWVKGVLWLLGYRHENVQYWGLHHLCPCGEDDEEIVEVDTATASLVLS